VLSNGFGSGQNAAVTLSRFKTDGRAARNARCRLHETHLADGGAGHHAVDNHLPIIVARNSSWSSFFARSETSRPGRTGSR